MPSFSIFQNPSIVYNSAGTYNVQLALIDGTSNDFKFVSSAITVAPGSGVSILHLNTSENLKMILDDKEYPVLRTAQGGGTFEMQLLSMEGKVIRSISSSDWPGEDVLIETNRLTSGVYILNASLRGETFQYKLSVQ